MDPPIMNHLIMIYDKLRSINLFIMLHLFSSSTIFDSQNFGDHFIFHIFLYSQVCDRLTYITVSTTLSRFRGSFDFNNFYKVLILCTVLRHNVTPFLLDHIKIFLLPRLRGSFHIFSIRFCARF